MSCGSSASLAGRDARISRNTRRPNSCHPGYEPSWSYEPNAVPPASRGVGRHTRDDTCCPAPLTSRGLDFICQLCKRNFQPRFFFFLTPSKKRGLRKLLLLQRHTGSGLVKVEVPIIRNALTHSCNSKMSLPKATLAFFKCTGPAQLNFIAPLRSDPVAVTRLQYSPGTSRGVLPPPPTPNNLQLKCH